jgi:hypothetical protein
MWTGEVGVTVGWQDDERLHIRLAVQQVAEDNDGGGNSDSLKPKPHIKSSAAPLENETKLKL